MEVMLVTIVSKLVCLQAIWGTYNLFIWGLESIY